MSLSAVQYVIYQRPRDFPNVPFVVRRWFIRPHGVVAERGPWALAKTLEAARESIPGDLVNLGRLPGDDRVVVEVWT